MCTTLAQHFPNLRQSQQRGLALWVWGTILAHSACQNAVIAALWMVGPWHALRERLREWLYDGGDKTAPCRTQVDVSACFGPLIQWMLTWWKGQEIALAVDATTHKDRFTALSVSLLYRSCAIPLAWHILPGNCKGAWMSHLLRLVCLVGKHMPRRMVVLVMVDRGLWSRKLWRCICRQGWHPLQRVQCRALFQPKGASRRPANTLASGPGHVWVGQGRVFRDRPCSGTLLVVWMEGEKEPWVLFTDLKPKKVGPQWYGLRVWIEEGFRALKREGWKWEHTRRVDQVRVSRHWLVMAVATLWTLAYGTRAEDAEAAGVKPCFLQTPPPSVPAPLTGERPTSVFRRGLACLNTQLGKGRLWRRLWLRPERWPDPPAVLRITYHTPARAHAPP